MTCLVCGSLGAVQHERANAPMQCVESWRDKNLGTSAVVTDQPRRNACKPNPSSAFFATSLHAFGERCLPWKRISSLVSLPLLALAARCCFCCVMFDLLGFGLSVVLVSLSADTYMCRCRRRDAMPSFFSSYSSRPWRPAPVATTTTGGGAMPWPLSLL